MNCVESYRIALFVEEKKPFHVKNILLRLKTEKECTNTKKLRAKLNSLSFHLFSKIIDRTDKSVKHISSLKDDQ